MTTRTQSALPDLPAAPSGKSTGKMRTAGCILSYASARITADSDIRQDSSRLPAATSAIGGKPLHRC